METKYKMHLIFGVVLLLISPPFFSVADLWANEDSKYLDAVREFADNVLKYGRDTYGPKHTPLFVDGLNVNTHEPVKWISPKGDVLTATETEEWILSNFASQQTLLRTLDGLTEVTGDPKYRDAAMQAIKYAFENLRSPNGLFYWGHVAAYDASTDKVRGQGHCLKLDYPYYELLWKVNPNETKRFIESYWSAHVNDWSNLDFNRSTPMTKSLEKPWDHPYDEEGPTFFKSKSGSAGFFVTATSLVHAGTTLYMLSHEEPPLVWSNRLAKRFVDTRNPNTGIGTYLYNTLPPRPPLGDDLKEHFRDPRTMVFPFEPFEEIRGVYYPKSAAIEAHQTVSLFRVGESLKKEGKQFIQWALEELTAWGKASYRKKDNSFVPILTDGTKIEGYISKKSNNYGPKGAVAKPRFADLSFFWAYAVACRTTGDAYMWEMTRDIAIGNSFGDIGRHPEDPPELEADTACSDVYALLSFLELYGMTSNPPFLQMARRIGDNIVDNQFHKGFFVLSKKHIYTRFDCFEPLALLHLEAAIKSESVSVPQLWPSCPLFASPYRYKQEAVDRLAIYALTDSPEPPLSLQEAASIGDLDLVRSLLEKGIGVDSWDDSLKRTALQHAAIKGHREVVELLLTKGARIDAKEDWPGGTALHYASEYGHKEVAELLIAKGADMNAERGYPAGDTPLHSAAKAGHKDIVELLITKGSGLTTENNEGKTPLHVAVQGGHEEVVKLLISKGADVNAKANRRNSPLHIATAEGHRKIVELLITRGADINTKNQWNLTPLELAKRRGHTEIVELFRKHRAKE